MTTKYTGGHAFPTQSWEYDGGGQVLQYQEPGMTLRDYFAAKAMQAMITRGAPLDSDQMALDAYVYADAMLAAREKL